MKRRGPSVAWLASPEIAFGVALFFVALLPRLAVALHFSGEPVWDGHYYDFGARRIAAGFGYSDDRLEDGIVRWHPWCHYPVGYSAVLGAVYRIFGTDLRVASTFDASVGALVCVATWLVARRALSSRRARIAGVIAAIHPGLVLYSALVMTELLSALVTLVAFWLATRRRTVVALAIGALVLGLGALVRPQALLCAPFFALLRLPASFRRLGWGARPAAAVLACALALVPVLPWTARNCKTMDGCALVSTNAGWNLAIGSFSRATGRFETLHATDGCTEVTGQVQQDRCWFRFGLDQIRAHPWRYLHLIPAKLSFTFDHESFAVEYLREARPALWPEPRRVLGREIMSFAHRLLVCASALAGIAFVFRRRGPNRAHTIWQGGALVALVGLLALAVGGEVPHFYPIVLFACAVPWLPLPGHPTLPGALKLLLGLVITTAATHAIFFGEDRYHVVTTPALCVLAAAALRSPARRLT